MTLSIINTLKSATQEQHSRLHHHPVLSTLVRKAVTWEQLASCIYGFACFYGAVKNYNWDSLSISNKRLLNTFASDHIQWAAADLALMPRPSFPDIETMVNDLSASPFYSMDSEESVWAYLYVTEGSLLGGNFIVSHLGKHLPDMTSTPKQTDSWNYPSAFFTGHGAQENKHRWLLLCQSIEERFNGASSIARRQHLIISAQECFAQIEHVFSSLQPLSSANTSASAN